MKYLFYITGILLGLSLSGCSDYWDKHYLTKPETVDQNIWDVIQNDKDLSMYVEYMKKFKLDTMFEGNNTYTLFVPVNSAFTKLSGTSPVTKTLLEYNIVQNFIQSVNVQGKQKVQTLSEKFGLFENAGNKAIYDGLTLDFESPLYVNGKYFKMSTVAVPKPSLYEFIAQDNQILKKFIDDQDSVILDKEKSRPLGFDKNGNTIYDTVSVTINMFEVEYFPVSKEYRDYNATIAFPKKNNYESALDVMAQSLGGQYKSHTDIPAEWQYEILIPYLLDHGIFLNLLEISDFLPKYKNDTVKLKNVQGDSVVITYLPANRTLCSNGYFYDYSQFIIPDSLYSGKSRLEGESLLRETGVSKFAWIDGVKVTSTQSFEPVRELIAGASNDSILKVNFPKGYTGIFNLQFKTLNLFPRRYLMVIRTHMDIGGKYNIYINNQLVRTFEYYDYVKSKGIITGVTGIKYLPVGRFNKFDCVVDNITSYGKATVKFEYAGPNNTTGNGLIIDYIDFLPY